MKNKIFLSFSLFLALLVFASCKKCITCTYTFQGKPYTSEKTCGSKKTKREEMEKEWKATAEKLGVTATCKEEK